MSMQQMNFVASINILDRGDGPAQEVLSRTARNRALRQQDETRDELNKITTRVDHVRFYSLWFFLSLVGFNITHVIGVSFQTLGQFELVQKAEEEAKQNKDPEVAYVSDLDELQDILSDQIKKRKVTLVI